MKMVAAAKLRRSQEAILSARPYAYRIYSLLLSLAQREGVTHPLLEQRPEKKVRLIIIAGDRGLCGSFNANIFKESMKFIRNKKAEGVEVQIDCIGKKANDYFKKRFEVSAFHDGVLTKGSYNKVAAIADENLKAFLNDELDAIYMVYNEFKSAIQQKIVVERLIPVSTETPDGVVGIVRSGEEEQHKDYIFEPSQEGILQEIVPRHFKTQLYRAVLESMASEHGARMAAMESASKNASEMIDKYTLQYNKARQASITKELMEIVSGVEAMR
jgi:F-type H+-transporting ATPase subunit gamma